jgi:hypothetical protein
MDGIGTGIGGIASSASYYSQLSADLTNDIEHVHSGHAGPTGQPSISGPPKSERVELTAEKGGTLPLSK